MTNVAPAVVTVEMTVTCPIKVLLVEPKVCETDPL